MVRKIHRFQKKGDYVVVGKGLPRSVGLRNYSSAVKYARYFKEKGKRPRIIKV